MDKLLVISASPIKIGALLGVDYSGQFEVTAVESATRARRLLRSAEYDIILINSPLPDEYGDEVAMLAAESTEAGILVFVRPQVYPASVAKFEKYGIVVLSKTCSTAEARQVLRLIVTTSYRIRRVRTRTAELQKKLEELKVIGRAKCVLIQYLGLTEEQAHKQIEREAMDSRRPRYEVAKSIITTYER